MWRLRTLLLILTVVLSTLVFGLLAIVISIVDRSGDILQKIAVIWGWVIVRANRITVRLTMEDDPGPGPYLIVSNHQSYLDIPALLVSLPFNYRMVAKKELFRIPIFGWGMKLAGYIEVDRGDTRRAIRGMSAADRNLREGRSIVMFPEGTRSRDGALLPLKKGAFVLAIKNQVPILPCAVEGSVRILPKGTLRMGRSDIRIHLGKPIETKGLTLEDRNALKNRVEDWLRETLSACNQSALPGSNEHEGREPRGQ